MCGRAYSTVTEEEMFFRYLNEKAKRKPLGLKPNYNICPTQSMPVVFVKDGERTIEAMRWGLIPMWAKDVASASKYSLINAKGEEISEKRSYKVPFQKRRCIFPLSGFYEWVRPEKGEKRPFAIQMKDESIMSVVGVWEHWESRDSGEIIDSFSIITIGPNSLMAKIHDRMPVILDQRDEEAWLDPENQNMKSLQKFLKPCPSSWLRAYEVSTLVNSPRNNRKEVLDPIA